MKISIITSLYKSGQYLEAYAKAVEKFVTQTAQAGIEAEVVVIANDPEEAEKNLANRWKEKLWAKFFAVPREPLYASWNRGVDMSTGSVLGFWNADDIRYASAVIESEKYFAMGSELVYFPFFVCRYVNFFGHSFRVWKSRIEAALPEYDANTAPLFRKGMLCGPFFLFTRALYGKVGPFDEQFKIAGDFDWCVRAAMATDKFKKAKSMAGEFRVDGRGLSAGANATLELENKVVGIRHGGSQRNTSNELGDAPYNPDMLKHGQLWQKIGKI